MNKVTLLIDGMACNHCTSSVAAALTALDGVETVQVSLEDKTASIIYDSAKLNIEILARTVDDLGFSVIEMNQE